MYWLSKMIPALGAGFAGSSSRRRLTEGSRVDVPSRVKLVPGPGPRTGASSQRRSPGSRSAMRPEPCPPGRASCSATSPSLGLSAAYRVRSVPGAMSGTRSGTAMRSGQRRKTARRRIQRASAVIATSITTTVRDSVESEPVRRTKPRRIQSQKRPLVVARRAR